MKTRCFRLADSVIHLVMKFFFLKFVVKFIVCIKMEASPQSNGSTPTATIMDLNGKCIRKIFTFLDQYDLPAVADVCVRFRENAVQSVGSKFKKLELSENSTPEDYSKLRNFGTSVESLWLFGHCRKSKKQKKAKLQKRLIRFAVQYCVGESIALHLSCFDLTDALAFLLKPMLGRVHELSVTNCQFGKVFVTKLPLWSPKLRELDYSGKVPLNDEGEFDGIHQKFPKLEYIHFSDSDVVKNSDIVKFLELNPQVKKLDVDYCDSIDDNIFQSIVKSPCRIERLRFVADNPSNRDNIKYLGQLRELKSLMLSVKDDRGYVPQAVHEIASANIALETLIVSEFDMSEQFIEGLLDLRKIKTLHLTDVNNMATAHLMEIGKSLKDLSKLWVSVTLEMTTDDLLKFIQNAEKLQEFRLYPWGEVPIGFGTTLDVGTFEKLVKTVEQRSEKIPLQCNSSYNFSMIHIPFEIIRAARDSGFTV